MQYVKRVIVHPAFHNISFAEAEKLMDKMAQGEVIVRPSSKVMFKFFFFRNLNYISLYRCCFFNGRSGLVICSGR